MTDDPTTNRDRRRDGGQDSAVGAVLGATLGPLGAAIGSVTDGTRFALGLSVDADGAQRKGKRVPVAERLGSRGRYYHI